MSTPRFPGTRSSRSSSACTGTGSPGWPPRCPATTDDPRDPPARPARRPAATPEPASTSTPGSHDMSRTTSTDVVMAAFAAVERRDERRLAELYHPEVEFHWPPSLPYGGSFRGATALQASDRTGFDQVWDPFQPTRRERRMEPRAVA